MYMPGGLPPARNKPHAFLEVIYCSLPKYDESISAHLSLIDPHWEHTICMTEHTYCVLPMFAAKRPVAPLALRRHETAA
jgi:hypothetical protein